VGDDELRPAALSVNLVIEDKAARKIRRTRISFSRFRVSAIS
jgi:hypothetical protein